MFQLKQLLHAPVQGSKEPGTSSQYLAFFTWSDDLQLQVAHNGIVG